MGAVVAARERGGDPVRVLAFSGAIALFQVQHRQHREGGAAVSCFVILSFGVS